MNFQESLLREQEIARNMTRYPSTYFDKDESYIGVFGKLQPGPITILTLMEINSEALVLQNPRAGGFIRRHGGMTIDGRRLTEGRHVWSELQEFIKGLNVELEAEGADPVHVAAKYHMRMANPQATVTTTIINMLLDGDWVFIKVRHLVVASSKQFIALNCAKSSEKRWTRGKSGKGGRRLALHVRRGEKPHKTYSQLISMVIEAEK
ncbi:hypothetical protein niasHT_031339 [Heterodera trifolii]|uniref:Uncharacterized protein n=1 Tax=Heterodera trifolii TaxID=157864 RepID=A0ABD2J2D1_9BILA